ncbi:MAG: hypothetical protein WC819_03850 [Parcubacteria group bacterium]|jgi:hypothetical protein
MKKQVLPYKICDCSVISRDAIGVPSFFAEMFVRDCAVEFSDSEEIARRRKRDVDVCVRLDNYFTTLAIMIDLAQKDEKNVSDKILNGAKEDLAYLQREYYICRREDPDEWQELL